MNAPDDAVEPTKVEVPVAARTGAIAAVGLDLNADHVVPRRQVVSWAMWDWATQPFNSVILTFVFTALYLTTDVFLDPSLAGLADDDPLKVRGLADLASGLGLATTIAGLAIALLAPVMGQRGCCGSPQVLAADLHRGSRTVHRTALLR